MDTPKLSTGNLLGCGLDTSLNQIPDSFLKSTHTNIELDYLKYMRTFNHVIEPWSGLFDSVALPIYILQLRRVLQVLTKPKLVYK